MKNTAGKVDGGIVTKVLPLSSTVSDRIAVVGVWSGGRWDPQEQIWIQQFRAGISLGQWKVVGVTLLSGHDTILQLALPEARPLPAEGDILVFCQGSFTILDIATTTLPIKTNKAVEVGRQRYHGVALTENGIVRRMIVFHSDLATIAPEVVQCIWWQDRPYQVELIEAGVRVV
jgi:hypothetical protein